MTFLYSPLLWIIPLLMGITYAAYRLRSGHLSRPASRQANKSLAEITSQAYNDPQHLVRSTVYQIQHDGLTRKVQSWITRAAQAFEALAEHDARVKRLAEAQSNALQRRDKYIDEHRSAGEEAPYLGRRIVGVLYTILIIGDITIVSMAIQLSESHASVFVSTAGSLALAASLFILGKVLGDSLKDIYGRRLAAVTIVALGIAAFSTGLYLLRLEHVEAWLILATAPAIGAAGVSLLGPSRLLGTIHRSERAAAKTGKRYESALKKRAKIAGRLKYLVTRAHLALVKNGLRATSQAQMAGIENAVTSFETIANELGISLGTAFQHLPVPTLSTDTPEGLSDTSTKEAASSEDEHAASVPSNDEGSSEVDLSNAPVFVPDLDHTPREEPS